jgi:undecaprenyl diphosphate synthase
MSLSPRVPQHVAIIMDGNGRWAKARGHLREYGHVRGSSRVKQVVKEAGRLGVKALTLFAFSTENWKRPEQELSTLWKLLIKFLNREVEELDQNNVQLRAIGEIERLNPTVRAELTKTIERLYKNTGLILTLALSYGSRNEWVRAARKFAQDCVKGLRRPEEMTDELMSQYLDTAVLGDLADVDLVIRTSGEKRISNFLLWQSAYAEYVFLDLCWPDFSAEQFRFCIDEYARRERRFGGVSVTNGA